MKQIRSYFETSPLRTWSVVALVAALLVKFLWPAVVHEVPLGYDPGIYRYLFLKYAEALRHGSMPDLLPWAQEYPPALYVAVAPLLWLGIPVDMLIGWMWNLVPVVLACTLAYYTAKRTKPAIGVVVLLIALISQPYFDGFYAMYIKVYVSLIFLLITYDLVERMSLWFPLTALLTVVLHQQTGLILVGSLGIWWLLQIPSRWKNTKFRTMTLISVAAGAMGLLYYLPQWERAIWSPLKSIILLRGDNAPAGSFPDYDFYLRTMPAILLLGLGGFLLSFKKERGSLWQLSVVIPFIFIVFRLVFYKRFFLLFDFFLMPYAATMLFVLWEALKGRRFLQGVLVILLLAQLSVSLKVMDIRTPGVRTADIERIEQVAAALPENAGIIAMENISGTWLRGWAPNHKVGAPGLFDYPGWSYEQWGQFIDGTSAERKALLGELSGEVYFLLTPTFTGYYGDRAKAVMSDPCLKSLDIAPVLASVCSK